MYELVLSYRPLQYAYSRFVHLRTSVGCAAVNDDLALDVTLECVDNALEDARICVNTAQVETVDVVFPDIIIELSGKARVRVLDEGPLNKSHDIWGDFLGFLVHESVPSEKTLIRTVRCVLETRSNDMIIIAGTSKLYD